MERCRLPSYCTADATGDYRIQFCVEPGKPARDDKRGKRPRDDERAAAQLGVDGVTVWRWLRQLVAEGVRDGTERGERGRATTYRYRPH